MINLTAIKKATPKKIVGLILRGRQPNGIDETGQSQGQK
jgi:hypothetical protein